MTFDLNLPGVFAQQQSALINLLYLVGIIALVFVLPFVVGQLLANMVRMRDYGWKIGLIIASVVVALLILGRSWDSEAGKFDIPLGVDLKGGVILVYELDTEASSDDQGDASAPNMDELVKALTNRINPSGTKEIVIRPYGDRQVEIIIPEVDPIEVDHIKRLISTAGSLEFRIVANSEDHKDTIELANAQSDSSDPARRLSKKITRGDGEDAEEVGRWVRAAAEKLKAGELAGNILRNATTGERLSLSSLKPIEGDELLEDFLERNDLKGIDVLVATDDGVNVTGEDLGAVSGSVDEYLQPCVNFRMQGRGVQKFQYLTSQNLPNMDATPPFYRHLGIILDDRLLSFRV
jgi:SecD/SecF fusion protein